MLQYVLYTYQSEAGQEVCHAYGPTDQPTAEAEGTRLEGETAGLAFMVLPLEQIPAATNATVPAPATRGDAVSDSNPFDPEPSSGPAAENPPVAAPQEPQDAPAAEDVPQEGANGSGAENPPAPEAASEPGSDPSTSNEAPASDVPAAEPTQTAEQEDGDGVPAQ